MKAERWIRLTGLVMAGGLCGCVPRIEVSTPKTPITINMNVKIDHEIHISADEPVESLLQNRQAAQGEKAKAFLTPEGRETPRALEARITHHIE